MNCWITVSDGVNYAKYQPGDRVLHLLLNAGWIVVRIYRGYIPQPYMEML